MARALAQASRSRAIVPSRMKEIIVKNFDRAMIRLVKIMQRVGWKERFQEFYLTWSNFENGFTFKKTDY